MKNRRIISIFLLLSLMISLCACGAKASEQSAPEQTLQTPEAVQSVEEEDTNDNKMPDFLTGTPWIASNVDGAVKEDTISDIKDDFFLHVNKEAILNLEIPDGYSYTGTIINRVLEHDNDMKLLFDDDAEATSKDARLAKSFYNLFLDWDTRNAEGVTTLKNEIELVEKIDSIDDLSNYYLTVSYCEILGYLFNAFSTADIDDSSINILGIDPTPLLLEDSAEYDQLTEYGTILKEATDELALYTLSRLGYSEEESRRKLDNCYSFEKMLAPAILTADEQKATDYMDKINNHVSYEELESLQGSFPLTKTLDAMGYIRKDSVILTEPEWLKTMSSAYTQDNLNMIKDYLIVHGALEMTYLLDKDLFEKSIETSNKTSGTVGRLSDEQYAQKMTDKYLTWQVARLYCEKFVTENDKEVIEKLCKDIINEYGELLKNNRFFSDETKTKAIEKLQALSVNALYPDDWSKYSDDNLSFKTCEEGGTLVEAYKAICVAEHEKECRKLTEPVDKTEWPDSPTTINAFYSPQANSIYMLAAFCRGDIYNSHMSIEEIYAKVGAVIGHEISHSFDGTGSQFDKDGNFCNWWTDEDKRLFEEKIQAVADYADSIYCWDGTHINGSIVTGEMCADMGGISVMLHLAKDIDGFDYDRFFRSYADIWLNKSTYNRFISKLHDEHPPEYFRTNVTLQQFDEFYECYDIKEGDKMYLSPEKRVAIW